MSASLLRGLRLLELVAERPRRQSDLARALGVDHAGLSRSLAALEAEGWVVRLSGLYQLGVRAHAFGAGHAEREFIDRADRIVRLLTGLSGLAASAVRWQGGRGVPVALSVPDRFLPLAQLEGTLEPTAATASNVALFAQFEEMPTDDPGAVAGAAAVRAGEVAREDGGIIAGSACLALPWPAGAPWGPTALALTGYTEDFAGRWGDLEDLLRASVDPGAGPNEIVRAAGGALRF